MSSDKSVSQIIRDALLATRAQQVVRQKDDLFEAGRLHNHKTRHLQRHAQHADRSASTQLQGTLNRVFGVLPFKICTLQRLLAAAMWPSGAK